MKRFQWVCLLGIGLLLGGQSLSAQTKQEKKEAKEKAVKEQIDSGRYRIQVNRALPFRGGAVNLTTLYALELRGDSVISYLPYFGRAYSLPYGGGEGMTFEAVVSDYHVSYDKKKAARIQFKTRTEEEQYTFRLHIFPGGSATIDVTPVHKQGIRYQGDLTPGRPAGKLPDQP